MKIYKNNIKNNNRNYIKNIIYVNLNIFNFLLLDLKDIKCSISLESKDLKCLAILAKLVFQNNKEY